MVQRTLAPQGLIARPAACTIGVITLLTDSPLVFLKQFFGAQIISCSNQESPISTRSVAIRSTCTTEWSFPFPYTIIPDVVQRTPLSGCIANERERNEKSF